MCSTEVLRFRPANCGTGAQKVESRGRPADLPGHPGRPQPVETGFLNLISNAIEAMEPGAG